MNIGDRIRVVDYPFLNGKIGTIRRLPKSDSKYYKCEMDDSSILLGDYALLSPYEMELINDDVAPVEKVKALYEELVNSDSNSNMIYGVEMVLDRVFNLNPIVEKETRNIFTYKPC